MEDSSVKLLSMMGEASVLAARGRAIYANAEARSVLGEDCVGKRVTELFGDLVAGVQAPSFLAQIRLGNRPFLLRISRLEKAQIYFLQPQTVPPALLNRPFLYSLRASLMNVELAAGQLRTEAETLGNAALLEALRTITRSQFALLRQLDNASLILAASEGEAACMPELFNLSALCASIIDGVSGMVPGIRFLFRGGDRLMIRADVQLVKNLLMNLLSNAIRHGKGCSQISLSLMETERNVVLAVDDDGCGIPPEELPRVFDRYRHSYELRQLSAGPGMGLTAARMIAQLHNGALLLESRPGQGTTLRISLQRDGDMQFTARTPGEPVLCQTRDLLTGLADCLPAECFSERWLD